MSKEFPFESGFYSVRPGLRQLTGPATSVEEFSRYRREKLEAVARRVVYLEYELTASTRHAAIRQLSRLLSRENPECFMIRGDSLFCSLTGQSVALGDSALWELPMQMTEDVAVVQTSGAGEYLAAGHICLPSSWRLEDKIGRSFAEVHAPVPGIPLENASALAGSLASKGPYERFAWGLTNEDVLDQAAGTHVDVRPRPLFVRIERQTTHPLPECGAWIFLIHPINVPVASLTGIQRERLADAVESMTPEQAAYKGLANTRTEVVKALRGR